MPSETQAKQPDARHAYTPGQLDVINELKRIQEDSGLSDGKFASQHLTIHGSTWLRIKDGTYGADPNGALLKLEGNLRMLRIERAQGSKLTGGGTFHRLTCQQQAIDAVTTAKLKPAHDPDRLVVYLAETGGGKSALGRQLKLMHDGVLVEARESWRDSYFAALSSIALAAGVSEDELNGGKYRAECALLKKLKANRRVLIIDEGEYFGPRTINLVKLLLNQTESVVVVLAIPAMFQRWQLRSWEESRQLNRRAHAVINANLVLPDEVKLFLSARCTLGAAAGEVCAMIARAANEFGRYDTVTRIMAELAEVAPLGAITPEAAEQAIRTMKSTTNRR